jgi:hypothetical protein
LYWDAANRKNGPLPWLSQVDDDDGGGGYKVKHFVQMALEAVEILARPRFRELFLFSFSLRPPGRDVK